ncbi:hypothetical protein BH11PLA2_BH11PLA2_07380 [soil metagenome]
MSRFLVASLITLALSTPLFAEPPAGSWKLTLPVRQPITILFAFTQADGKWVADVVDITAKLKKEPKFKDVSVVGDAVKFTLALDDVNTISFDGIASKDGKSMKGSMSFGGTDTLRLIELFPSKLKALTDPFEIAKEGLSQTEDAEAAYENAAVVLKQAAAKKMPADEVRSIIDRVSKMATANGRRWDRYVTLKLADLLAGQPEYAEVALAQARKAERMLTDDDEITIRMATLEALVKTLLAAKKTDDAKPYQTQLVKLEAREWLEYAKTNPAFKVEEYKGRKAKNDRVILVETFSGANFEASAAVDLARDGLLKMYKPSEVIVLTYHLPLNNEVDALTVNDNYDRMKMYGEHVQRGRHGLVAGKPSIGIKQETGAKDAQLMFETLRDRINEELELPAKVKLTLELSPGKDGFQATAKYSELEKPGENMVLRFALAEDRIRYTGSNGVKFHQMVVRALPGGAKGFPLKVAAGEQSVTVQPHLLKQAMEKFLEEMAKDGDPIPADKVTALKNLKVVAFIQNDTTSDILTAATVDVK